MNCASCAIEGSQYGPRCTGTHGSVQIACDAIQLPRVGITSSVCIGRAE